VRDRAGAIVCRPWEWTDGRPSLRERWGDRDAGRERGSDRDAGRERGSDRGAGRERGSDRVGLLLGCVGAIGPVPSHTPLSPTLLPAGGLGGVGVGLQRDVAAALLRDEADQFDVLRTDPS